MVGSKAKWADIEPGYEDPLSSAMTLREEDMPALFETALEAGNTALAFQPVAQCRDQKRIAYWQSQLRLYDARGIALPVTRYKTWTAGTETARRIDCAALELGMQTLAEQRDIRLAVRMSARSVGYRPWIDCLMSWFKRVPNIGERLVLEVSESSAVHVPELIQAFMRDRQQQGVCFALDEFGSGNANLGSFRDSFFDIVKIHGAYIQDVHLKPDNRILAQALALIAHRFDMLTVATQVENTEDRAWLLEAGIDYMQGNLIAPPTLYPRWLPAG